MSKMIITGVLVAALAGASTACDDPPTGPSPNGIVFIAQLSPANEVPSVSNPEASGSGFATITLTVTRDNSGTITAAVADFQVTVIGFPPTTALTMAHIHIGATGANGDIVVNTGLAPGEVVLGNGSGAFAKSGISIPAVLAQDLATNPAGYYFNIHSVLNGGGVARGQLVLQQ